VANTIIANLALRRACAGIDKAGLGGIAVLAVGEAYGAAAAGAATRATE